MKKMCLQIQSSGLRLDPGNSSSIFQIPKNWLHVRIFCITEIANGLNLYIVYSCSYHKKLLNQGWLYVSTSNLSFYSYVLGVETKVLVEMKEIKDLRKESSKRGVFSDSIKIITRSDQEVR